ncbi:MAG: redoxin domain-containing protein [Bacteroidales bacterium]|nr:redoxin domain-containing protein [Bacteroidales bacterium]
MNLKKTIFFLAFIFIPIIVLSQNDVNIGYTIKGKIDGLKCEAGDVKGGHYSADYIYLYGPVKNDKQVVDSAKVINGEFIFKGRTDEPIRSVIFFKTKDMHGPAVIEFFIENSNIAITGKYLSGSEDPLENIKITGSAIDSEYKAFREGAKAERQKNMSDDKAVSEYYKGFFEAHPDSYIELYDLGMVIRPVESSLNSIEEKIKAMSPKMQNSFTARQILRQIAEERERMNFGEGNEAIEFSQPDINGKVVKLSDFKGKYVLIDFWASWCGGCRAENPNIIKAYNKYHAKGLEILSISLDTDRKAWLKAVLDDKLPWQQLSDLKKDNEAAILYKINTIPENFLIDPNGKIVAKGLRGKELDRKLSEVFLEKEGKQFIIKGEITNAKQEYKIHLACWALNNDTRQSDSTVTKDGKFEIKGVIPHDLRACISAAPLGKPKANDGEDSEAFTSASFFLSSGTTTITGSSFKNATITGTALQNEFNSYNTEEDFFQMKIDSLYKLAEIKGETEGQKYVDEAKPIWGEIEHLKVNHIKQHPESLVSLMLLANVFQSNNLEDSVFEELLGLTQKSFGTSQTWLRIQSTLETRKRIPPVGSQSMDFTKKDINGNTFTLSSLKGKYVILDFWGSWCSPCRASHPHLREIYEKYKSMGLEIVGVANERNKDLNKCFESWKKAVKEDGMTWIQVLNDDGSESVNLSDIYAIEGFPTKILLDKEGKIIFRAVGNTPEIYKEITKIFGE